LENGEVLTEAETAGFEILLTTDKRIGISKTLLAEKSPSSYWDEDAGASSSRMWRKLSQQ
jgi:hypothetical protein